MLCGGVMAGEYNVSYINHMNNHHQAYINIELLFNISLLGDTDLELVKKFVMNQNKKPEMVSLAGISEDNLEVTEPKVEFVEETVVSPVKVEVKIVEDNDNHQEVPEDPLNNTLLGHVKIIKVEIDESAIEDNEYKQKETIDIKSNKKRIIKKDKRGKNMNDCEICGFKPKNSNDRSKHIKIVHHGYFNCKFCRNQFFKDKKDFDEHMEKGNHYYKKDKSNICNVCGFVAKNIRAADEHKYRFHDDREYSCDECGKHITGRKQLVVHKSHHKLAERINCDKCGKEIAFASIKHHNLTTHASHEEKPYKCDECDKGFPNSTALKEHRAIHSDLRPFQCRWCDFGSKSQGNWTKHEKQKHKIQLWERKHLLDDENKS